MNLIEKYGYKPLKNISDNAGYKHNYYSLKFKMWCVHKVNDSDLDLSEVRKELLEYRRKNGIYEFGDKIVFIDEFMHDEIMTVSDGNDSEVYMDNDRKRANIEMVRHANDNEIKENRRILSQTQSF